MAAVRQGSSIRAAARRCAIAPSTAIKLMRRVRKTGAVAPACYGGHRRPILEPYEDRPVALVEATADITLAKPQNLIRQRFGVDVAVSTILAALRRHGLTHKRSP